MAECPHPLDVLPHPLAGGFRPIASDADGFMERREAGMIGEKDFLYLCKFI
jgi:hypothetical protein